MNLNIEVDRLISFIGYGPASGAEIVFLGLSEAGGGIENLAARSAFSPVEDLYEAHKKLSAAGVESPFDSPGNPVQQWNNAARFALALEGNADWANAAKWSRYWRERLGRRNGNTLLTEVSPFPRPSHAHGVPGIPRLTAQEVWERRFPHLRRFLKVNSPKYVIAYGEETRPKVEQLLRVKAQEVVWQLVKKSRKPAHVATIGTVRVAHVQFFGQGRFACEDIPIIVAALKSIGEPWGELKGNVGYPPEM